MNRFTPSDASYDLERFVRSQAGTYDQALAELTRGRKQSHWMWFVFPQIAGLGSSDMSRRYAIVDVGEARAYLAGSVLALGCRRASRRRAVDGHTAHENLWLAPTT